MKIIAPEKNVNSILLVQWKNLSLLKMGFSLNCMFLHTMRFTFFLKQ